MSGPRSQVMMTPVCKNTIIDEATLVPLATVVVGVYPDERQQFSPLAVVLQVDNDSAWKQSHDLPRRREMMASVLNNDGLDIKQRFFDEGDPNDLNIAIALHRKAAEITPQGHSAYAAVMTNLANAIEARYDHAGHMADLDLVVALLQTLVIVWQPPRHTTEASHLSSLADALGKRYNVSKGLRDLDDAISLRRQVVELTPPPGVDNIDASRVLAQVLQVRFHDQKDITNLDEAIELQRVAYAMALLDDSIDDRARDIYLQELTRALTSRFRHLKRRNDLEELIKLSRKLIGSDKSVASDQDSGSTLSLLGILLHERFEQLGSIDDLDEAISIQLRLLDMQPAPHHERHRTLVNLSSSWASKFKIQGHRRCLDDSISFLYEALELVPAPHEQRPRILNNISINLRRRFEEANRYNDLLDAIDFSQEALKLEAPSAETRISVLSNLAAALWSRYEPSTGTISDLDYIISLNEKALGLTTQNHANNIIIQANLGNVLRARFNKTGEEDDLKSAISLIQKSLRHSDPADPQTAVSSLNLGLSLGQMYILSHVAAQLEEAVDAFRSAAIHPNAPVSQKFIAARAWAEHADRFRHPSALEAYRLATSLLPLIVALNADLNARQQRLLSNTAHIDGLAVCAAGCAIEAGELEEAIELLEQGRSMFWSQAMKLRSPIEDLEALYPELASRVRNIRRQLENQAFDQSVLENLADRHHASIRSRRLIREWDTTLAEIRQLPGFETFLQPHSFATLQKCILEGPVVILCVTRMAGHAIVMSKDQIKHLPLPEIDPEVISQWLKALSCVGGADSSATLSDLTKVFEADRSGTKGPLRRKAPSADEILKLLLRALWTKVVEPVVKLLNLKKSPNPKRVAWYPTGQLTFLPIHAAGIYDDSLNPAESITEYAISSYLPTLSALLNGVSSSRTTSIKVLAVAQPQTLPHALEEVKKIQGVFKSTSSVSLTLLGDKKTKPATLSSVIEHLSSSSIVHFACHGKQHIGEPLNSALALEDSQLTLPMIMEQRLEDAQLAFLSACETAKGEREAPDENLHLGAALLFSGFKGVVATMWSIADIDAPKVAEEFYKKLIRKDDHTAEYDPELRLDTSQAARALHHAIQELRGTNVPLQRWVPFIYLGA